MQQNLDSGSRLLEQDGQRYLGEWRTLASGPNYKVLALLHKSLDQAALKWVRDAKFTPAKVDGAPQAVCGHTVDYEWTLNKR